MSAAPEGETIARRALRLRADHAAYIRLPPSPSMVAAAREMLDVLEATELNIRTLGLPTVYGPWLEAVRAVCAKARGES